MNNISASKINEICSVVKDHSNNIVRTMAQCILENMNTLDIDQLNRMFVSMMCQIARTPDSPNLIINGPIHITSPISCTSQEEYNNLSDYDKSQVDKIYPEGWSAY